MAFFTLASGLAAADHGAPVLPPKTGVDWTTWLLIVGAVAAVGLAAWAFLAPDRTESRKSGASEGVKPGPPAR
jgi:LPXTG-motif cell wall-anchored protein